MRTYLKAALLASSVVGLTCVAGSTAFARDTRYDDRRGAITFSLETGGYCDSSGCPDHFWKYPIHYGPVFVQGHWYRGPVYFRGDRYGREYWVRGAWHRDEWRGRRPDWARSSHDGPALGFSYYADHGFQLEGHWRHQYDADNGDRGHWNGRDDGGDQNADHGDHGRWNGRDDGGDQNGDRGGDWHGGDNGGQGDGRDHSDNSNRGDNRMGDRGSDRNGQNPDNVIHVTTATYGGTTCHQPSGNVTKFLADACNGKKVCDYAVQYQAIGDPAPGCAKDFAVQWTCSVGAGGTASAAAEAGLGSHVVLQCSNPTH